MSSVYRCDRCGNEHPANGMTIKTTAMQAMSSTATVDPILPPEWEHIRDSDLCPGCLKVLDVWLESWPPPSPP